MQNQGYASLESQIGNTACECEDTEEMFWLRQADDYESRVKLGNLLSGQYRFKEAIETYHSAELIRDNDSMLYVRLGGAYLTIRDFDRAKEAYQKCVSINGNDKQVLYPMGVWHYLKSEYSKAAEYFSRILPCEDEMAISVIYWHALSCMQNNTEDNLINSYNDDMKVGHHTAYKDAVEVILGKASVNDIIAKLSDDDNDLNVVVTLYGILVYLENCGKKEYAKQVRDMLLKRNSVWPCISYLAAWNDQL